MSIPSEQGRRSVVLASASPRRRELLSVLLDEFQVTPAKAPEPRFTGGEVETYVREVARAKAVEVVATVRADLVIGADTVVAIGSRVLGKPRDSDDAREMLSLLSGNWHRALTGLCLVGSDGRRMEACEETRVKFADLSAAEIEWYVGSGEPLDRAGAYAIQGLAAVFIDRIEGDYTNVVGMPLRLLYRLAGGLGFDFKRFR